MFSRSEKTEEAADAMSESSQERSPLMLAGLAGLLAIAGIFLLIFYLGNGDDDGAEEVAAEAAAAATEAQTPVLVVTQVIPQGLTVTELINSFDTYLTRETRPEEFISPNAIASVADLEQFAGLVVSSELMVGDQLSAGRFRTVGDFESNNDSFIESNSLPIPDGHHAVVVDLPASRALGGNIRANETIAVIGDFNLSPADGPAFDLSLTVLSRVEVLAVESFNPITGEQTQTTNINDVRLANNGTIRLTVAVEPHELTDLFFTLDNANSVSIATALPALSDDEDGEPVALPRSVTTIRQLVGDDGEWLLEVEEDNIVDLITGVPSESPQFGTSIEVDFETGAEEEQVPLNPGLVDDGTEDPGDS